MEGKTPSIPYIGRCFDIYRSSILRYIETFHTIFDMSKFDISIHRNFPHDFSIYRSSIFRYIEAFGTILRHLEVRHLGMSQLRYDISIVHQNTKRHLKTMATPNAVHDQNSTIPITLTAPFTGYILSPSPIGGGVAQICPQIKRAEPFEYPKKAMHQLLHRYMVHPSVLLKWNRTAQLTTKGTRKCETLPEDDGCIQRLRRSEQCFSRSGPSLSP